MAGIRSWSLASLVTVSSVAAVLAAQAPAAPGPAPDFRPDWTFTGSTLAKWTPLGAATWRAENGELVGTPAPGGAGGWLVLNESYQDVNFYTKFRCAGECRTGVLFRLHDTPAGKTGVFVSLAGTDLAAYRLTLDAQGRETAREKLDPVGPFTRTAPVTPPAGRAGAAPAAPGRGRGFAMTGAGRGGAPLTFPTPLPELMPPPSGIWADQWNAIGITMDADVVRSALNASYDILPGATGDRNDYGPIALYAGGASEVRFRDVSVKDLNIRELPAEKTSPRFRVQRIDDFYYAWGANAADFNRDGVLDVVAGPYYYLGPDYTSRREIYVAPSQAPSTSFAPVWWDYAYDFTGDGWPDILAGESRPMALYVNPKGERRRWARYAVLPQVTSEFALMRDLDGDGRPEAIYGLGGVGGTLAYAAPDAANPTARWPVHQISERGVAHGHGLGAGDINGDGRVDIVQAAGWWEQPSAGPAAGPWTYHPQAFGRWGRAEGAGGAEIEVYDVNGDKLNDVVTGLNAHGWGLAWFEQRRAAGGAITFERHMIIDDYSTKNAGGVVMSEMHASALADVDGDGIPDYITGKRVFSHQESYVDPDPFGTPALYWFRTVRNPRAPGGAEFVPELIHNRSGVGAQFAAIDLNKDGAVDIITSTTRGTFIFWGTRRR